MDRNLRRSLQILSAVIVKVTCGCDDGRKELPDKLYSDSASDSSSFNCLLTVAHLRFVGCIMGAYKYVEELYKKKQSDVLRFLLRVRYVTSDLMDRIGS